MLAMPADSSAGTAARVIRSVDAVSRHCLTGSDRWRFQVLVFSYAFSTLFKKWISL